MTIVVAGDVHGSINNFYEKLIAHQETMGRPEISNLIEQVKPRFAFSGHHHRHIKGKIGDTIVVGLANAQADGGLYAI